MTICARMPLVDLLRDYRDGDEHGWATEFAYLKFNHGAQLADLMVNIVTYGVREPILLGADGRVWDGHHRLCVADTLGLADVPVRHA